MVPWVLVGVGLVNFVHQADAGGKVVLASLALRARSASTLYFSPESSPGHPRFGTLTLGSQPRSSASRVLVSPESSPGWPRFETPSRRPQHLYSASTLDFSPESSPGWPGFGTLALGSQPRLSASRVLVSPESSPSRPRVETPSLRPQHLYSASTLFVRPAPQPLLLSEAKVDISPPELLPLGGYTARHGALMEPGGSPLYARCIVLQQGSFKIALVSAEMLTIPDSLYEEVKKEIPAGVVLFLCATHTHSAPDSQMLNDHMTFSVPGIATFHHRWLAWYADRIAGAVEDALDATTQQVFSLDVAQFNEHLNRGRRPGAKPETLATALEWKVGGVKGAPIENLFMSYPAHPVFFGPENEKTSGDWPGKVAQTVEESYPGTVFEIYPGAIGDVSPAAPGNTPEQRIDNFSAILLGDLAKAQRHLQTVWSPKDRLREIVQPIVMDPPTPSPAFVTDYRIPMELAQIMVQHFAQTQATITAVRLGSMGLIGIPGEPTSHLGRAIRTAGLRMGFKSVLVISHVNGWIGYILDPADYTHGGYEASLSFNGAREGVHVVDAAIRALKTLAKH